MKKLQLNKEVIAQLDNGKLSLIRGGTEHTDSCVANCISEVTNYCTSVLNLCETDGCLTPGCNSVGGGCPTQTIIGYTCDSWPCTGSGGSGSRRGGTTDEEQEC